MFHLVMKQWKSKKCNVGNGRKQRKMNNLSTIQAMHVMVCNLPVNQYLHLIELIIIIFILIYARFVQI